MNMYIPRLGLEAAVVGAVLALALLLVQSRFPPTSHADIIFQGFVVGIMIHLGFELFRGNKWFCTYGAACMT